MHFLILLQRLADCINSTSVKESLKTVSPIYLVSYGLCVMTQVYAYVVNVYCF